MTDITASVYTVGATKFVKLGFTPVADGDYAVEIRAFDVHANSKVVVLPFAVSATTAGDDIIGSAVTNATTAGVFTKVELSNKSINMSGLIAIDSALAGEIGTTAFPVLVREIKGGRFALIGTV